MTDMLLNVIRAALVAGRAILEVYASADMGVEMKADNSPLTRADKASNAVLMDTLTATELPVLSEEGRNIPYEERSGWQRFWLVDPLDGTKEFIKRNGEFTTNVALIDNGTPIAGVVYAPVLDTLYFGSRDMGAYRVEFASRTDMSSMDTLLSSALPLPRPGRTDTTFVIVGSRSHPSPEFAAYIDQKKTEHDEVDIRSIGSSLKICLVAEGTADVYPRLGPTMEWDTGAGHAVALAAGCTINVHETGTPLQYNKENLLNPFFIVSHD